MDQSLKGGDNLQYEMIKCRSGATKVLYRATWKQEGKNVKWSLFVCFERQTNKEKDLKTTRCVGGLIIPIPGVTVNAKVAACSKETPHGLELNLVASKSINSVKMGVGVQSSVVLLT